MGVRSNFYWPSVDKALLTETHLFIFLAGPIGYPIPIADVGQDDAQAACDYALRYPLFIAPHFPMDTSGHKDPLTPPTP